MTSRHRVWIASRYDFDGPCWCGAAHFYAMRSADLASFFHNDLYLSGAIIPSDETQAVWVDLNGTQP